MRKSWKLIDKILSGSKSIESRWYSSRYAPWNRINPGEIVYFKDSGSPVTAKAEVSRVLQFSGLDSGKVKEILHLYSGRIGIDNTPLFLERVKDKKYCILVFLKNARKISPFDIDKAGYGLMSAWVCVEDVKKIIKQ